MFSAMLVERIAAAGLGLTNAVNLFTENGVGDQCVVVKTTNERDVVSTISKVRAARIQVLLTGYTMQAGHTLATSIAQVFEGLSGDFTYETESYHIYSVEVITRPIPVNYSNTKGFSSNFDFCFRVN